MITLGIKIDVDTDRGTRIGVPKLLNLFDELEIPATFLFSLGPDNTGRAIKRIFRPGFLKKVARSNVVAMYGIRTLLNGVLLPGPHIGKRNAAVMRQTRDKGHEVGIHCYDHIRWQDNLHKMMQSEVIAELKKARDEFQRIFNTPAKTAGAAGWQASAFSLAAYDAANFLYASDTRGTVPFFPRANDHIFKTLQLPTTLPTLDELLGRPDYPYAALTDHYLTLLQQDKPNIFTIHAEIEGMQHLTWFKDFLQKAKNHAVKFATLEEIAKATLANPEQIAVCALDQGTVDGRASTLAIQGKSYNLQEA